MQRPDLGGARAMLKVQRRSRSMPGIHHSAERLGVGAALRFVFRAPETDSKSTYRGWLAGPMMHCSTTSTSRVLPCVGLRVVTGPGFRPEWPIMHPVADVASDYFLFS